MRADDATKIRNKCKDVSDKHSNMNIALSVLVSLFFVASARAKVQSKSQLNVHAYSIPAHGHYMTTKGIVKGLAARGHNVTFALCERNRRDFENDKLGDFGIHFLSLGDCPVYDERERVLAAMILNNNFETAQAMFSGMTNLSQEMCEVATEYYDEDPADRLPDVIFFDADTYCAMDLSVRYKVPRVARVGTGLRDPYTTPLSVPSYSTGLSIAMNTVSRIGHALLLFLSRYIISPFLTPNLYSRDRSFWSEGNTLVRQQLSNAYNYTFDEAFMRPNILWDGVPTLYNTHWGLEHARHVAPYEHLIGHTNDFEWDASIPLPPALDQWLRLSPAIQTSPAPPTTSHAVAPVVYVGLGTLSILPDDWVNSLALSLVSSRSFRFVWSLSPDQQTRLPILLQLQSARIKCETTYSKAESSPSSGTGATTIDDIESTPECAQFATLLARYRAGNDAIAVQAFLETPISAPGNVLLVEWAPQVAVLSHPSVSLFVTHGGMNGVAEGTFAKTPMLCMPLFSDQPDNCMRLQDRGMGILLQWSELNKDLFNEALDRLYEGGKYASSYRQNIELAWQFNIAAGGVDRGVALVETAARMEYGAHLLTIPRRHFLPWYEKHNLDVLAFVIVVVALASAFGYGIWKCAAWFCCKEDAAKDKRE